MAWKDSYAYGNLPGDTLSTPKYNWASRPEITRTGDLKQYNILSRYLAEEVSKEPLFEEVDDTIPSGEEEVCLTGLEKMKSEDSWSTLREITLRARPDFHPREDIERGRKDSTRQSNSITFQSRKMEKCSSRPVAKDVSGVKTSFFADRQPEKLPDKETNLAGCKAGISGLLFSSVCSSFAKANNAGQKRYSFGNFGCTSAPDVYLPTSATKVVRASADWDAKRVRHKPSKVRRDAGGSVGTTFANHSGKGFERRAQVTSHPISKQSSTPLSRKQMTPIVDPDIRCSKGLSLTTDAALFDCVVPNGNAHACFHSHTASKSSENANRTAGTYLERSSREHSCSTNHGEKPEQISDVLELGYESGCPVAEVSSIGRSRQLQRSRHLSGGGLGKILSALERSERRHELSYEQLLMLEATLLLGGIDIYDQHRDWRLDVDSMSYEDLLELGDRIGYVNTGLSEETIFQCLKKMKHCILEASSTCLTENERKCSICQEEYEPNDELGKLQCGHSYHVCCIRQWLLQKNACPVCKASALSQ